LRAWTARDEVKSDVGVQPVIEHHRTQNRPSRRFPHTTPCRTYFLPSPSHAVCPVRFFTIDSLTNTNASRATVPVLPRPSSSSSALEPTQSPSAIPSSSSSTSANIVPSFVPYTRSRSELEEGGSDISLSPSSGHYISLSLH
jgi:hypothetical protein